MVNLNFFNYNNDYIKMSINKLRHERSSSMYDRTSFSNSGVQTLRAPYEKTDLNP